MDSHQLTNVQIYQAYLIILGVIGVLFFSILYFWFLPIFFKRRRIRLVKEEITGDFEIQKLRISTQNSLDIKSLENELSIRNLRYELDFNSNDKNNKIELQVANQKHKLNEINTGGYIVLDLPDNLRSVFSDLLKGFEDFAKLKGYLISFSVDTSEPNKIGFKFTIIDGFSNVSTHKIRQDILEYIERINNGSYFDDLPVVISIDEHHNVSLMLNNKIKILEKNYDLEKEYRKYLENLLKIIVNTNNGFGNNSNIQIINTPYSNNSSNNLLNNSDMKLIGRDGIINEKSPLSNFSNISFGGDNNQKNEVVEQIEQIKDTITKDTVISSEAKSEALDAFEKLKEEAKNGKVEENTYKKALDWGAKIASVGSLVVNLIRLFGAN